LIHQQPLVSIIIVGYNSKNDLGDCLQSVAKLKYRNFEVIFVDNSSSDDSVSFIKTLFPWIKIVACKENFGFCKACNIGVKHSAGDYFVFLNPDTRVDPYWLSGLLNVVLNNNKIGVCGSTILVWTGDKIQSLGGKYSLETGYTIDYGFGLQYGSIDTIQSFSHCCGASLLVRRDLFEEVGGFDNTFFMYFDDVDLCWRIRLLGYEIRSSQNSIIYHKISLSRAHSSNPRYLVERNSLRAMLKNYELKSLIKFGPIVICMRLCAFVLLAVRGNKKYAIAILKSIYSLVKNFPFVWQQRVVIQKKRIVPDSIAFPSSALVNFSEILQIFKSDVIPNLEK
jgi:GT2 family glycosyltransferase